MSSPAAQFTLSVAYPMSLTKLLPGLKNVRHRLSVVQNLVRFSAADILLNR